MRELANWGYQIGTLGIMLFTISFLTAVRWWTDLLGRILAGVLSMIAAVLLISTARMFDVPLPGGIMLWRVVVFWLFATSVWTALGTFVWAQFWAPRVRRKSRMTTRREYSNEEADRSDPGYDPDGSPDRVSGGHPG